MRMSDREKRIAKAARIEAEKEQSRALLSKHNSEKQKTNSVTSQITTEALLFHALFIGKVEYAKYSTMDFKGGSKNHHRRALEIAKQLFGPYKVPKILNSVWNPIELDSYYNAMRRSAAAHKSETPKVFVGEQLTGSPRVTPEVSKFRDWYITIANGGSFYKEHAKEYLTRKEAHTFLDCPFDISIVEALKYSISVNAGANTGNALRIAKCKLQFFHIASDHWREVIRFFSKEVPASVNEMDDIIDWLTSEFQADANFKITGRGYTIDSIRKRVKDWHYALRRVKLMGNSQWAGHAVSNFSITKKSQFDKQNQVWTITQILNTKDLAAEGTAQHHCVYSYRLRCASGACSIWSVRVNGNRKLTIELLNDGTIVQMRGYANRVPTGEERNIVAQWASANNLVIGRNGW